MCGPITLALITRTPERPRQPLMSHFGRISMYALLGALVASFSATVTTYLRNEVLHTAWLLLPNLLLLFSALYLMGFQQAYAPIEKAGQRVWRALEGVRSWASARGGSSGDYLRGAIWGLLPCGMIYSALGLAVLAAQTVGWRISHGGVWCVHVASASCAGHAVQKRSATPANVANASRVGRSPAVTRCLESLFAARPTQGRSFFVSLLNRKHLQGDP
jgi:hypothetical protein